MVALVWGDGEFGNAGADCRTMGGRQGNLAREFADNLRRCQDRAFLGRQGSESLRELIVAVVLPRVGHGEELFCGGQFGG